MSRALLATALCTLPALAQAQDKRARQYRTVDLVDGRTITAEVLGTEAIGMRMRTPQGEGLVAFEELLDMVPVESEVFEAQDPWIVAMAVPDDLRETMAFMLGSVGNITVRMAGQAGSGVSGAMADAAGDCGRELECIVQALEPASWRWVIAADQQEETGALTLAGGVTTGNTRTRVEIPVLDNDALWRGLHEVIGLVAPDGPAPRIPIAGGALGQPEITQKQVVAMGFAPVPGLPSLAQGDAAGFGLALGVVVPSTALWVGAIGGSAESPPELIGLGALGFYAITVFTNQFTGMSSFKKAGGTVSVAPVAEGTGAVAQIQVRR